MAGVPWGGSEELWARTAVVCKQNDHRVLACVYNWGKEIPQVSKLIAQNINVLNFDRPLNQPKRFYKRYFESITGNSYDQKVKRNLKKVDDFSPDVICISQGSTFNISANEHVYNYLMATKIPFVIICQHNIEYGGGLPNNQVKYEKQLFDKAQAVLFVSERNLETAKRQLAAEIENAVIVSNPININAIGLAKNENSSKIKMACVSRLDTAIKGQDILLQALSAAPWKTREFQLNLYGEGPDAEYINRLINFYALTNKVKMLGQTNDINAVWRDNNVLVLPSTSEGTPLSLVEAMLCGRTAVVTDVGDMAKYIKNGITGFLAPAASLNCLSVALEELWSNRNHLKEMGENAYWHALSITDMEPEKTLLNILIKAKQNFDSRG